MVKKGQKHSTHRFGNDAEAYLSRLFLMHINQNGTGLPDLVSANGDPPLAIEVKSGKTPKGILCEYQLAYGIDSREEYRNFFGEEPPNQLFDVQIHRPNYNLVISQRNPKDAAEMQKPYSGIQLDWGDGYLISGEQAFYMFAASKAASQKRDIKDVITELKSNLKKQLSEGIRDEVRKRDRSTWQDLLGTDLAAIFRNDPSATTKQGRKRIELLQRAYPGFDSLIPLRLPGPNGTIFYVLTNQEDVNIFDNHLRKRIEERMPVIEEITREREEARGLLDKIEYVTTVKDMFAGEHDKKELRMNLTPEEITKLKRLEKWLAEGETTL